MIHVYNGNVNYGLGQSFWGLLLRWGCVTVLEFSAPSFYPVSNLGNPI